MFRGGFSCLSEVFVHPYFDIFRCYFFADSNLASLTLRLSDKVDVRMAK